MSMKTCKTAVCASALMAVAVWSGGAFAAVTEDFEGTVDGQFALGTAGTVGAGVPTVPACGYPGSFATHAKILAVTGTVTYTEGTAPTTGASQVDLMFKVEPTDELEAIDDTTVQTALAVGETNAAGNASIKLWCKVNSANTWLTLKDGVTVGSWMRATLVLDYSTHKVRVSLDGDPIILSGATDAWYAMANNGDQNYVKTITMVGSTELDDLVVSHTALNSYAEPFSGEVAIQGSTVAISYDDLNKYGVTKEDAQTNAVLGAGMTIADKVVAGLNPKSDTKFEMQTMTATSSSAATITFPGNKGASGYTVTATADAAGTGSVLETATVTPGAANADGETINSAAFSNLPDSDLIYFHLKTN